MYIPPPFRQCGYTIVYGSLLALLIPFSSGLLNAAVVPGRWEKVDSLPANTRLTITLKSGNEADHIFNGSDSANLSVQSAGGAELVIPKADVAEIVQHKPRSKKPTLIGAAVGGAVGAGIGVAVSQSVDETFLARADYMAITWGLIGAGAGALIGHFSTAEPPDEVLYQAP